MVQSLWGVYVHVVFSTKDRKPLILENSEKRLHNYLATIALDLKCHPFEMFKEEYINFLKWSKIEFDEKFLWD